MSGRVPVAARLNPLTGKVERLGPAFSDPSSWLGPYSRIGITKPTLRARKAKRRARRKAIR